MDPAGVQLDEEQHVQPPKPDGVDGEEVTGEDPGGLLAQKRPPRHGRSPWRGVQAMAAERFADHGRRDAHVEAEQFALDPLVAPAGILPCQADDQLLGSSIKRWTAGPTTGIGPHSGDQAAVPAHQRLRLDEQARPAGPRQHAANGSQQGPIGRLEPWSRNLAAQHGELVAQHQDLQILGRVAAGA
jgi:hypothetical protein